MRKVEADESQYQDTRPDPFRIGSERRGNRGDCEQQTNDANSFHGAELFWRMRAEAPNSMIGLESS